MSLENHIRGIAEIVTNAAGANRYGVVTAYNSVDHRVKVKLLPDGIYTYELPNPTMGGARYAPVVGQVAFLAPDANDSGSMVIQGYQFNDQALPVQAPNAIGGQNVNLQPGEWMVNGPSGSCVRICADGSIFISSQTGLNIQAPVTIQGPVAVTGTISATQNISSQADVIDSVRAMSADRVIFDGHTHPLQGFDEGQTNIPTQQE